MPLIVTVRLHDDAEAKLRRLVKRNGGSLSAFVRAAVDEKLEREAHKATPHELGKHLFGRDRGGPPDLAENHEKYFKERMRAKHRR